MSEHTTERRCPKCGTRLSVERLDHQLSGQERVFCPVHGEVGRLNPVRARDYPDARPDRDEFE
ncbi:MAG TPA: hypothetical protein VHX61_10500 [Rhizomicrobium sp.]|nr:hypothetical protein [Rhizomicrobium sp.]